MPQFPGADKDQWRQLEGAAGNDAAAVTVNGTQQAGNFLGIRHGGHVFPGSRRDSAAQIAGWITLGPARGDGIPEDLPAVLLGPVRRLKGTLGLNPPKDRQQIPGAVIDRIGLFPNHGKT